MTRTLTWTAARRIALRSQGIGPARRHEEPTAAASRRALRRTLEHTHLLQIDSVSVFARAHHLPVYTRSGAWDPAVLDRASRPGRGRLVHEALAHEAVYTTEEVHALLDFRRRAVAQRDWGNVREAAEASPRLLPRIIAALEEIGPSSAAAISRHLGDTERGEGWGWRRTSSQWVVEYLFRAGCLDCVGRSAQFERLYVAVDDAAERLAELATGGAEPTGTVRSDVAADASTDPGDLGARHESEVRELVARAARALGIAEISSLADYFRLRTAQVRPAVEELLTGGVLEEVVVRHPAGDRTLLLHRDAPGASPLSVSTLVSPFDPIVFHRPRLAHLFDVDYRIGIYTPAAKRTTGYYALPFLHQDLFPARVDLRAARDRGVLEVRGAFREPLPHVPAPRRPDEEGMLDALAAELRHAARWQGLDTLEVAVGPGTGSLSAPLRERLADARAS
ncbi:crosslink repair DNA glycosylase YcaQ family protein [Brachybacterium sp. J144]|uniref:winged helix-turn-helix domain-containing protein n=1 Tax=Brachybacterium sp. J144 TaxID=3116487 RepID=UPI002E787B9B|nr:crosslink repair DNA glycosylase YcaQ family protein [Brachybacterium sp. J144]MEE1649611.1 crosslink repair DNA glycosylase YcaQ family protein [Brachybacterium sp. J144]